MLIKLAFIGLVLLGMLSLTGARRVNDRVGADDIMNIASVRSIKYAEIPFDREYYNLFVEGNTEKVYTIKANELEILKDLTKYTSYYPTQKFTFPDWCYIVFPLIILFLPIRGRREQTPEQPKEISRRK